MTHKRDFCGFAPLNAYCNAQELLLKCNSGTQKYIDEIEARKAREARQSGQDKSSKTVAEGAEDEEEEEKPDEPSSTELDNQALEKIMGIVSTLAQHLPAPPEATSAAEAFLSKLKEEEESKSKEEKHSSASRERHRGGRRETRLVPSSNTDIHLLPAYEAHDEIHHIRG